MSLVSRLVFTVLPLGLGLGAVLSLLILVKDPGRFPLRIIEIQNELKWMPSEVISQMVSSYLEQGFFGVDVEAIQSQVNSLPWIASSEVQRVWPDKISIRLTEQSPLARFGEKGILSTEGKVFYPESFSLPSGYPWFRGPEKAAIEMLKEYLDFLEMLSPLGLSIAELNLSEEGVYKVQLDNGIAIILGKTALAERLSRFILVYPSQLKSETARIAYLDLRYTNGMAIGWKAGNTGNISNTSNPSNNSNSNNSHHSDNTIYGGHH